MYNIMFFRLVEFQVDCDLVNVLNFSRSRGKHKDFENCVLGSYSVH